jgi:hypothetical protein
MPDSFFTDEGAGRYAATALTRGPWDAAAQHAGPPSALLGRCLEAAYPRDGARVARITVDILGPVPIGVLVVRTEVIRPGRSIELLGATASVDGVDVLRAQAWRLRTGDIGLDAAVRDLAAPRRVEVADPETLPRGPFFAGAADVGYHTGMDFRFAAGSFGEAGPARVWMRMAAPLLPDEAPSPLVRVLVAADSGNGVSGVADPRDVLYVNTDLTVTLHRQPRGEWVLLDARTVLEPDGIGQATSGLHDRDGALGTASQTLFVARR